MSSLIPQDSRTTSTVIISFHSAIKALLSYGELEPVVATESQTSSLPVPLKVMGHMRSCGAAIIHVEGERKLFDADTKEVVALNENVLIEIGSAMALYGDRFILLVKDGVKLPSNLQGLYEVRRSERWTYLVPIWVALIVAIAAIAAALIKSS
jgi:hypothetical protein